jgi:uncharacterized glyoxalase superfamily protein PhnB
MAMTDTAVAEAPSANPQMLGGIVPHIFVSDAAAASEFYQRAFGAKEIGRMPTQDGQRLMHCHIQFNGGSFTFMDASLRGDPGRFQGFDIILPVDDIDAWWERAVAAGAKVVTPVETMFWGDRFGELEDPFGVHWCLDEPPRDA